MNILRFAICGAFLLVACGASPSPKTSESNTKQSGDENKFQTRHSTSAADAHGVEPSKIKATASHAAMKFFVIDKIEDQPIAGIVIALQGPDGKRFYTEETDALGYGEVLVPIGQSYELVYLSLGRKDITAKVDVEDQPFQNVKLTLRYKRHVEEQAPHVAVEGLDEVEEAAQKEQPAFRLDGVVFDTGSSTILPESFPRLDSVVEYMTYKKSARIQIAGHTDNVGKAKANKTLSQGRADACRKYLIDKGIDGERIEAMGYGDEKPIASNNTDEGRQKNRRIEVREL